MNELADGAGKGRIDIDGSNGSGRGPEEWVGGSEVDGITGPGECSRLMRSDEY